MNKAQRLLNPLSMILRRTITSISHLSLYNSGSLVRCFDVPSPSFVEASSGVLLSSRRSFLGDSKFSEKCFCSESAEKISARCWNCNAAAQSAPFLFCESCRSIQPVDHSVDYFQIFGLEKKYMAEVDNLEGKYKDWQKKLHPDLVHSKSEYFLYFRQREREYAAEQSARVIDAYRTITKPLSRAKYMMKLDGLDVNEEETISEPELLAEVSYRNLCGLEVKIYLYHLGI
ncbi:iron-sulfur cluster co-chaperone protein HscB, mitochondrial isoform X1 [Carica papaya]|uniref:iron-sulfur cluster co-chaperone protein HscB, mitochondrial isoform X1 n=1 Tax=Carica papaya TaxID=3649 RepID=UPI000B8CD989|nr:iron-sulfur cluster co-chaperone protein HscB, mitochondrial isoform X1 [Carica papaya]